MRKTQIKWIVIISSPVILLMLVGVNFLTPVESRFVMNQIPTIENLALTNQNPTSQQIIPTSTFTPQNPIIVKTAPVPIQNTIEPLAEIASKTMNATKDTISLMQWVMLAFIGIMGSIIAYLIATIKETDEKLRETDNKLRETDNKVIETKYNTDIVVKQFESTKKQFDELSTSYFSIQQELYEYGKSILPYDIASKAFQDGKINVDEFNESRQFYSWNKWMFGTDKTGLSELLEESGGLSIRIMRIILTELYMTEKKRKVRGFLTPQELENLDNFKKLLNFEKSTQPISSI